MGLQGVKIPPDVEFTFVYPDYLAPTVTSMVEVVAIVLILDLMKDQVSISVVEVCKEGDEQVHLHLCLGPGNYFQVYTFTHMALVNVFRRSNEILDGNEDEDGLSQWASDEVKRVFEEYRVL